MERMELWKSPPLIYQWTRYLQARIASADPCKEKHNMLKYVFLTCLTYNLLCYLDEMS